MTKEQMVYLVMKHPPHPYSHRAYLEAGTVEAVFSTRKAAADLVAQKNKKATTSHWSMKAKRVVHVAMGDM